MPDTVHTSSVIIICSAVLLPLSTLTSSMTATLHGMQAAINQYLTAFARDLAVYGALLSWHVCVRV